MKILAMLLLLQVQSFSQIPIPTESLQLQQLINKSEEQLKLLRESIKLNKQDADSLERAYLILERLSAGIDKTIESYEGTKIHTDALILLQENENYKKTYSDSQGVRTETSKVRPSISYNDENLNDSFKDFVKFQKKSVEANKSDLINQEKLQKALDSSGPGFVPKIQALVQLGNWQTSTRLSTQNTELLAAIQSMREELRVLRILRLQESGSDTLNTLIIGSEIQNQKQKEKGKR